LNRAEIRRLTEKNAELIEQLKRFSEQVDTRMSKMKTKPNETPENSQEMTEQKILNEVECLIKMQGVYKTEIESLNAKLKLDLGPNKVIELEKKVAALSITRADLTAQIRKIEKNIKDLEKTIEKESHRKESEIPQMEETKLLKLLNKLTIETDDSVKKLNTDLLINKQKEEKIHEFEANISKIEKEIEELKKLATEAIKSEDPNLKVPEKLIQEDNQLDKDLLASQLDDIKALYDQEKQKIKKETAEADAELKKLKDEYNDLVHVFFNNFQMNL